MNDERQEPLRHGGGLAGWSIRHPVGVTMIALAVIVLGLFALGRLSVDLLPHLIYPEIRVRITDSGVPARVMEDQVTKVLEEQLAITEDAVTVQSETQQGRSSVDLAFPYGKDIDIALRDASTRLDRARRRLPDSVDNPVIYKLDPSQIPVMEFAISSPLRDPVELRSWSEDSFAKWFINLPGVAAAEIGGGLVREIQVLPDQQRLAGLGLEMQDIIDAIERGNRQDPAGRLRMSQQELAGQISGRFESVEALAQLPLRLQDGSTLALGEVAQVLDTHQEERLRVRADGVSAVKLSIQKQPTANTVTVADAVQGQLDWLARNNLLPKDIEIVPVSDQSVFVRQALHNSTLAVISGALLSMAVVYLFLGNLRRTLIIGSAIPIAVMVTFVLMGLGNLTLNIMTLGGLALGVGMLVDNTIVMLENIYRHQRQGEHRGRDAAVAAAEVNSAIIASTTTNLAAVLPFLFIGGLIGLLFRELIFTISAAILASMVIALTLVPALAARVHTVREGRVRRLIDGLMASLGEYYSRLVRLILRVRLLTLLMFLLMLGLALPTFISGKQAFLPAMDSGEIYVSITADPGTRLSELDRRVVRIEELIRQQPETRSIFTTSGGSVFGSSTSERSNSARIQVQLVPLNQRVVSSDQWIGRMNREIRELNFAGFQVRMRLRGIRGLRTSGGDDDVSLRISGQDLERLDQLARQVVDRLAGVPGLRNLTWSSEESQQELDIRIDRDRAAALGFEVEDLSDAMAIALEGRVITDFIDGDSSYDVRLRLPREEASTPQDLESILLFPGSAGRPPVYLGSVAELQLTRTPAEIRRDRQMRIVEISATLTEDATLGGVYQHIAKATAGLELPPGYTLYDSGGLQTLQQGQQTSRILLALALFLVFVVMAVQYESLRNPLVIMTSVPFGVIGVALGINLLGMPLSMPVWLGLIMLAGIVVNNAIVLVEYIELSRDRGLSCHDAIAEAARLRLRPILMTTLTTVVGMMPLAIGFGEGAEMLRPLAVSIVCGLSFSMLVVLLLVPVNYSLLARADQPSGLYTAGAEKASG
ncbi:cation transporter [Marinobacterium zhoushanense]|uniref:Cation transporter n=1 Tax=Marinobacterium zhoushanense TaxID=1679163 RepID=A0ABQ1KIV4_9GAMM|nr:efflux RND transporter permease subunit [Marinobacterium zhoushanense]GGB97741.1 cation transporter [Marinobacterium zhoushanense]